MIARRVIAFVVAAVVCTAALLADAQAPAAPPTVLQVITFNGGWNLPFWAAQRQGYFEANGVLVQLSYTPNSDALVTGLYNGKYDLAFATIDNFIAYQEGQGDVKLPTQPDFFAFMGGDGGFLSVVAGPQIKSFADLKGKTLSVDATNNGLSYVLRELVARGGVAESQVTFVRAGGTPNRYRELVAGKHDATLLRTPFDLLAKNRGLNQLGTAESLGVYQGTVGAARRSWAQSHEAALIGFLRGYRAGVDWVYDPANRDVVEALLVANIRDMTPSVAKQSYDLLLTSNGGIYRDLRLDNDGIATVLALRSKYGEPRKNLTDPSRYIDLSYYEKAFVKR
ncbi:MAG TPA: ABC transporter substrate-binding protein [Casimicrobiaceae bacterium]|nr:ABC transporter substrate-binding protein [Casimicrobiaceae bacterium]